MRRKIERARKHTDDLEAEIIAFWNTKPYEIEVQGNPRTGPGCYRIKGTPKPLPQSIALIAGDAAHNLRAALDHFACGAVPTVTTNTAFPVWRTNRTPTSSEWKGLVKRKLNGAAAGLIEAVTNVEAYKDGNGENVWAVDELDRIDKHRLLVSVAGANTAVVLDFAESLRKSVSWEIPSMPLALKPAEWTLVRDGAVLFKVESTEGFGSDPQFTFDVTLGEPVTLEGEPIAPALRRLIDEIDSLLQRLTPLA